MNTRVELRNIETGVPGLDAVLGGGLPEFSFNVIAGGPGCGKTTLAHQIAFAAATPERPVLYVSVLGEPPLKMLRYQQQFDFFDQEMVPETVRFLHLGSELLEGGLERVLECITREVESSSPGVVIVDSFLPVVERSRSAGALALHDFVQALSLRLTSWEATTFLVFEPDGETPPVLTVADGVIWLSQSVSRNSVVRKLRVMKMRGRDGIPGLHTMKLSSAGVRVYPRLTKPREAGVDPVSDARRATGIQGLDEMLSGGIPDGYSILVVGPSGSGKTVLTTQFILEGIHQGEPGVVAVFEKRPEEYIRRSAQGGELERLIALDQLRMLYLRPLDLSVDETMEEVKEAILAIGAKRVVIDSLSGFELALAPAFRADFRESLYRMIGTLTDLGVSVLMTIEQTDLYSELRLSPHGVSFLADGIIVQRYFERGGRIERLMFIAKLRGVAHSNEMRTYTIEEEGIVVGDVPDSSVGLLTGGGVHDGETRS